MGAALNVSLISHVGTACIGVTIDPAAVAEPARLLECLRAGFEEVLALAPSTAPPGETPETPADTPDTPVDAPVDAADPAPLLEVPA
jgi:hypothetical protein